MRKHILAIMAAAMIAGTITSCSKDGDDITVDRIHTTATADKISIETESYNETVILAPELLTAPIGLETNLDIRVLGGQDITCKSDDEKNVTISNGKLKGLAKGETSITISSNGKELKKVKVIAHNPLVLKNDSNKELLTILASNAFWQGDSDYQNGTHIITVELFGEDGKSLFYINIAKGKISSISYDGPNIKDISKCSYTFDKESQILNVTFDVEDNDEAFSLKGSLVAKLGSIPLEMMM